MRKFALILLLALLATCLSGCNEANQAENLAYVIMFGVDLTEDEQIKLTVQIPKISGSRSQSGSEDPGNSEDLTFSATGKNFMEALDVLQWAVSRRLDLSQIKLIVFSETLAKDEHFLTVANDMMDIPRLYTAALLAVCSGTASEFIEQSKSIVGARMATELTAMFENYAENGFIPNVTFADVYYKTISIYSDPVSIYAELSEGDESVEDIAQQTSLTLPESLSNVEAETSLRNRYLGAAIFQEGVMIGTLTSRQYLFCKVLRGQRQTFTYSLGDETASLSTMGMPKITIDTQSEPVRIQIDITFSLLPNNHPKSFEGLEEALEQDLQDTIAFCQQMGAEPFQFAEIAARSFATIDQWRSYDWIRHFVQSDVDVNVNLRRENL